MWLELTDRGVDIPYLLKHYSSDLSCLGAPTAWGPGPCPPVGATEHTYA